MGADEPTAGRQPEPEGESSDYELDTPSPIMAPIDDQVKREPTPLLLDLRLPPRHAKPTPAYRSNLPSPSTPVRPSRRPKAKPNAKHPKPPIKRSRGDDWTPEGSRELKRRKPTSTTLAEYSVKPFEERMRILEEAMQELAKFTVQDLAKKMFGHYLTRWDKKEREAIDRRIRRLKESGKIKAVGYGKAIRDSAKNARLWQLCDGEGTKASEMASPTRFSMNELRAKSIEERTVVVEKAMEKLGKFTVSELGKNIFGKDVRWNSKERNLIDNVIGKLKAKGKIAVVGHKEGGAKHGKLKVWQLRISEDDDQAQKVEYKPPDKDMIAEFKKQPKDRNGAPQRLKIETVRRAIGSFENRLATVPKLLEYLGPINPHGQSHYHVVFNKMRKLKANGELQQVGKAGNTKVWALIATHTNTD